MSATLTADKFTQFQEFEVWKASRKPAPIPPSPEWAYIAPPVETLEIEVLRVQRRPRIKVC